MAKSKHEQEMDKKLGERIKAAEDALEKAGVKDRLGSTHPANAALVAAFVEEMFVALAPMKRNLFIGQLNEIFMYIACADKAINVSGGGK